MTGNRIAAAALALTLLLTGCWDFRSTNDMTIVSGVAVDRGETGRYRVTFEIVDPHHPVREKGAIGKTIVSEGETLFDAVRNITSRLSYKLNFGIVSLLIISREIAEEEGINGILDWFYRDANPRETMHVGISIDETAADFLHLTEQEEDVLSYDVNRALSEDHSLVLSTSDYQLYQIYSLTRRGGIELTLPLFHVEEDDGQKVKTLDGIALFRGDKVVGYLPPEITRYYLFATDQVEGGLLNVPINGDVYTFEITANRTTSSYAFTDEGIAFFLNISTELNLAQNPAATPLQPEQVPALEAEAEAFLTRQVEGTIAHLQKKTGSDVLGFGDQIRRYSPREWEELEGQWGSLFPHLPVAVQVEVNMENSGLML